MILYASVGGGHAAAARALRAELAKESPETEVVLVDVLDHFPWVLRLILCDWYRWLLRYAPWVYGLIYWLKTRIGWARRLDGLALVLLGGRCLRELVNSVGADRVVSTYPATTVMLGRLRRRGRISALLCATITDLAGLAYSAHAAIDLHLVVHESCLAPVEKVAGAGSCAVVRPPLDARFFSPPSPAEARRRLALPVDDAIVVVSGGGWAVGDIDGAATCATAVSALTIVVTGNNERLRRRLRKQFAGQPRLIVLGHTERMPELLAAADTLIHSSGGVTALEALACGCPLIAYGAPPGHVRANDVALAALGLADRATSRHDLSSTLARVLEQRRPDEASARLSTAPTAASAVLAAQPRWEPARALPRETRRRRTLAVTTAAIASLVALGGWTFYSPAAYPLVASLFDLRGLRTVATSKPAIALIVEAPDHLAERLASRFARQGDRASFAFTRTPARRTLVELLSSGDEALVALGESAPTRILDLGRNLSRLAHTLGYAHRFDYLVPRSGLTVADYLAARDVGGTPIVGALRLTSSTPTRRATLNRGSIVVIRLHEHESANASSLQWLLGQLNQRGLHSLPLSELLPRHHRLRRRVGRGPARRAVAANSGFLAWA